MSTAAALPRVEGQHQNHALAAARRARALELVTQGMTYQQVADELGYASRGAVHRIVNRALSRETSEAVKELRELEVARPDALQAALWGRAMDGDVAAARTAMRIVIARLPALGLHRMLPCYGSTWYAARYGFQLREEGRTARRFRRGSVLLVQRVRQIRLIRGAEASATSWRVMPALDTSRPTHSTSDSERRIENT